MKNIFYQKNFKQLPVGSVGGVSNDAGKVNNPAPAVEPPQLTPQTAGIPRSELTLEDLPF